MNNVLPTIFTNSEDPGTPTSSKMEEIKSTLKQTNAQMTQAFASLIIASMGFMAALAWNDAAKNFFEKSPLAKFTKFGPFFYAIIATCVAFFVSKWLSKYAAPTCMSLCDKTLKDLKGGHLQGSPSMNTGMPPQWKA